MSLPAPSRPWLALAAALLLLAACDSKDGGPTVVESEPNGSMDEADRLTVGAAPGSAELEVLDSDWFRFDAVAGQTYLIRTFGKVDTYLELYSRDEAGYAVFLEENDDIDYEGADYNGGLEWVCPVSGTYYLEVHGIDAAEDGPYTISVRKL